jgi:magnesium-transporting ATPase (P-type)
MKRYTAPTDAKWHSLEIREILDRLHVDAQTGLTENDATTRNGEFGLNRLAKAKRTSSLIRFLKHFNDILIYILLATVVISGVLGKYLDAIVILGVAVINAVIGFIQENKAEKAIDDLKDLLAPQAKVLRNGNRSEIDAAVLTVGDIVLLEPGDRVPADLRIIRSDNLKIEEAALTGEAVPSEKTADTLNPETMLGDRDNMAFSGTNVTSGTGRGVVVAIGNQTEIGKINQMMTDVTKVATPLLKQTAQFGKTVAMLTVAVAVLLYVYGLFVKGNDPVELLMAVIALAVAAIPEGLPAILSIILAVGVQNMARRKATIRNLPSVETLGAVSIICSDKTGTLTKNEMTVQRIVTHDAVYCVCGTGYSPVGEIKHNGQNVDYDEALTLKKLLLCGDICNDSSLSRAEDGTWKVNGDPTEGALIAAFQKADIDHTEPPRIATLPFDSKYKYMATLVEGKDENTIYIKGAPDRLLKMTEKELGQDGVQPFESEYWSEKKTELARMGQRVLGLAYKPVARETVNIAHEDISEGMIFLGLVGINDPPKEEAIEAVRVCHEAGIRVKMITGDHVDTARAIGAELGIGDGLRAVQGCDIDQMTDAEMIKAAWEVDVFARTSPEHKLELVEALQENGAICAMTGDGVNDAPALRKADVGIAMGIKGTDVTKDAAEIVLVDDNFATIVAAVEEGRRVYDNLKKTILFILPTNGAVSFLVLASILTGMSMPLTPVLILWVNMVTSVTISLALAFERIEPGTMQRPPRSPGEPLLCGYFIRRIIFTSLLIGGATLLLDRFLLQQGTAREAVMTITLQTIVLAQAFHLFNCRSIRNFAFDGNFFSNKFVFLVIGILLLLQLVITYVPVMNMIFGTVPISLSAWIWPVLIGCAVFIAIEIEKWIVWRRVA